MRNPKSNINLMTLVPLVVIILLLPSTTSSAITSRTIVLTLTTNASTVPYKGSATLTWTSTGALSCYAGGGWSGKKQLSGSETLTNLTKTASYTLKCVNIQNEASKTVMIGVPPLVNITANPTNVDYGGSASLTWFSSNATSCLASGSWSGDVALSGGQTVSDLKVNSTYSLTCRNSSGSTTQTATITVNPAKSIDGQCGPANASVFSTTPPTNTLCSVGEVVNFQGTGPWTWTCQGANGGKDAFCSAQVGPTLSLATRIKAAMTTAKNTNPASACGAISMNPTGSNNGFYWEIGDENGIISDPSSGLVAAGSVQPATATGTNYTRDTSMLIASATKMLYGAYVVENKAVTSAIGTLVMPPGYVPFMNFTSGYTNMRDKCPADVVKTVTECLNLSNGDTPPLPNGSLNPGDVGYFRYNSGHLEVLEGGADPVLTGLMNGGNNTPLDIAKNVTNTFAAKGVKMSVSFVSVLTAGGANTSAGNYASLLRGMIRKTDPLKMIYFLNPSAADPYAVCTNPRDPKCVNAAGKPFSHGSPVPINESWHYGLAHWIEDDPVVGDGAYSSAGAFGFYPWIDSTKTYYGVVARLDMGSEKAGYGSVVCGRQIRKAFMTGEVQ